jgi:hypothetical protein
LPPRATSTATWSRPFPSSRRSGVSSPAST